MRLATKNTAVMRENGNLVLSFGYDFCAEHEFGIRGMQAALGVSNDQDDLTLDRFAVTAATPENLMLVEPKRKAKDARIYLLGGRVRTYDRTPAEYVARYKSWSDADGTPTAWWDEREFLFSAPADSKEAETVRKVFEATMGGNALLYLCGSANPFGGSGLVLVRRSTIPTEHVRRMEEGFRDAKKLREAAEATGIRERVEAWGRKDGRWMGPFHALSPRWRGKGHNSPSKHPVVFWLNPTDQQNNNFGWFTVEELEQWMEGRGPIPKKAAA